MNAFHEARRHLGKSALPESFPLQQYLSIFGNIPGYFTKEAMCSWDFLLSQQKNLGISGHFLEVGVLNGKSAALGAMYFTDPNERMVLIDINTCQEALAHVGRAKSDGVDFFQMPSNQARHESGITDLAGQYRFIHIDGDHSGFNVTNDLAFAASVMKEDGIVCMDDFFNPIYPQVTAAIYNFLFQNQFTMRMILCGATKCFLVRSSAYRIYENLVRNYFLDHAAMYGLNLSLHKSTYSHDMGCFSIWTENDRRAFGIPFTDDDRRMVGIDADNSDIVF